MTRCGWKPRIELVELGHIQLSLQAYFHVKPFVLRAGIEPASSGFQPDAFTRAAIEASTPTTMRTAESHRLESNQQRPRYERGTPPLGSRWRGCTGRDRTCDRPLNRRLPSHLATVQDGDVVHASAREIASWRTTSVIAARAPLLQFSKIDSLLERATDPGAGFEPALTDSESAVLPLDDPGTGARRSPSGGLPRNRTSPYRLRAGCSALELGTLDEWRGRARTSTSRIKSPVSCHWTTSPLRRDGVVLSANDEMIDFIFSPPGAPRPGYLEGRHRARKGATRRRRSTQWNAKESNLTPDEGQPGYSRPWPQATITFRESFSGWRPESKKAAWVSRGGLINGTDADESNASLGGVLLLTPEGEDALALSLHARRPCAILMILLAKISPSRRRGDDRG